MRSARRRVEALTVAIVSILACFALDGCYDPSFRDCTLRCGPAGTCPNRMTCKAGYCAGPSISCLSALHSGADGGKQDSRPDLAMETHKDASADQVRDTRAADRTIDAGNMADARDGGRDLHADAHSDHAEPGMMDGARGGPPTDAGSDGSATHAPCPDRQYMNVARHVCIPAHDLNADGRADLLVANSTDMQALISTGQAFVKMKWEDGGFWGAGLSPEHNGAYAADITGSGFAAAVGLGTGFVGVLYTG